MRRSQAVLVANALAVRAVIEGDMAAVVDTVADQVMTAVTIDDVLLHRQRQEVMEDIRIVNGRRLVIRLNEVILLLPPGAMMHIPRVTDMEGVNTPRRGGRVPSMRIGHQGD